MIDWKKYGISAGIVIAAIVAIYFYGRARYDAGRRDLRTELLLQKPEVTIVHDTTRIVVGEGVGKPLFDRKWTRMNTQLDIDTVSGNFRLDRDMFYDQDTPDMIVLHSDSCCYSLYPYIVQVHDSLLTGEIICKPDVQKALWRLRPISETREYTKYVEEQLSFWVSPIMGFNNNGTMVGGLVGYKSVGVGIVYDGSPTYLISMHLDF